ncbi:MAG: hypothetical protein P4M00_11185 [Azospirillaceae bacterium]|nr:hypothetical protein [Azospirillaceae bacterium]
MSAPSVISVSEAPTPGAAPATLAPYEERLINDLQRMLRYASTAKTVDIPKDTLENAARALQGAKSQVTTGQPLTAETALALLQSVDALSPRIHPATTASLEISELMEVGQIGGSPRQIQIRSRVKTLVSSWIWVTVISLLLVFLINALQVPPADVTNKTQSIFLSLIRFFDPIVLGFLGSCAYIIRNILQNLANQTFVLRDSTNYTLRSILGMVLGYMIPHLFADNDPNTPLAFLSGIAVPFLAGYAVEPMFTALDNVVVTVRDAVSRMPPQSPTKAL